MSEAARFDHGTVRIDLGGESAYVLKPTLAAASAIAREYGGVMPALQRVRSLDIDAIVRIVCLGINPKMSKGGQEHVGEKVFAAGLMGLVGPVGEYLLGLSDPTGRQSAKAPDGDPGND